MKTHIQKGRVKRTLYTGDDASYNTEVLVFEDIAICRCGCGGTPKIIQVPDGRKLYDYYGEHFDIRCPKCHITILGKTIQASGIGIKQFHTKVKRYIPSLVKKWNGIFHKGSTFTSITFKTNP